MLTFEDGKATIARRNYSLRLAFDSEVESQLTNPRHINNNNNDNYNNNNRNDIKVAHFCTFKLSDKSYIIVDV